MNDRTPARTTFDIAASLQLDRITAELDDVRSQPPSTDRDNLQALGEELKRKAEKAAFED